MRRGTIALAVLLVVNGCGGGNARQAGTPTSPTPPIAAEPPPADPSAVGPMPPMPPPAPPPAPAPVPTPPRPRITRTRFLIFGDSLTAGTTSPALTRVMSAGLAQSYPFKFLERLQARYTNQTFVVENEGKPAETAADGMVRLPPILRSLAPEIVVLLEGVNDISFLEQRRVTQVAGYVNTMAHDARFAGAQVIICTLPPQRAGGLRAADPATVSSYNQALRDVARGEAATLVDFANDFGDLSLIGADGLHPTEAGYSRMADILFDTVRRTFEMPLP